MFMAVISSQSETDCNLLIGYVALIDAVSNIFGQKSVILSEI